MMNWNKCGKIFGHDTFDLYWFKKNAMMPLSYVLDEKTIRLFVTMCDEHNIGRIGYVDVNADNPKEIINYSREPVIDIGDSGRFDDNGVVTASLFENEEGLYLFYSGYQLCTKIPYMIFSGVAVSKDRGRTFKKLTTEVPILDRIPTERNFRCVPIIIRQGTTYKMWYHADCYKQSAWLKLPDGKLQPVYQERYLESKELFKWQGKGKPILNFNNKDEYGLSIGSIWIEEGKYKCIYSVRSISKGYRLGYAESIDGIDFKRKDIELNIDISPDEFDSEMMCYPNRVKVGRNVYLFYSGNHYGMAGIGYAKLLERG